MSSKIKTRCQDCAPVVRSSHFEQWFRSWLADFLDSIFPHRLFRPLEKLLQPYFLSLFLFLVEFVGVVNEKPILPETPIHYRTRVIFNEAQKRGLKITVLSFWKHPSNLFRLYAGGKVFLFEGIPGVDPRKSFTQIDDKEFTRALLGRLGVPTPKGESFKTLRPALEYADKLGAPWVVKPRSGSLSNHARVNLKTTDDLIKAIRSAKKINPSFIVESFIEGDLYRATTVGDKLVAVARREPPLIIGNGKSSVFQLIQEFDKKRRHMLELIGYHGRRLPSLPPIPEKELTRIPKKGEPYLLTWKTNISYGGRVFDVTDEVHPETKVMFEKIAREVKLPAVGIDFIAPDIRRSYKDQKCAVIELNSLPSIDMHYAPIAQGKPRDIAGEILDLTLKS